MSLAFSSLVTTPIKKVTTCDTKSDLSFIWESLNSKSISRSPNPKFTNSKKEAINILSMLSTQKPQTPSKKFFCPPSMKSSFSTPQQSPISDRNKCDFLYSQLSITTEKIFQPPEKFNGIVTYVYKENGVSSENQSNAWQSFKSNAKNMKCGVVVCAKYVFLFSNYNNHNVKVKAFTGTAQKKLESDFSVSIQDDGTYVISFEDALNIIDQSQEAEKLSLYSTDQFNYSIVTPFGFNHSEFESSTGSKYRIIITGFLFDFQVEELSSCQEQFSVFKLSKNVLY